MADIGYFNINEGDDQRVISNVGAELDEISNQKNIFIPNFFQLFGACISWWLGAPQNSDYLEEKYQGEASIIRLMMTFDLSDFPEWYVPTELVCGNIQGAEAASYSKRSLTILFNLPADISPEKFQAKFEQKSDLIRESCLAEVKTFIYESYVETSDFFKQYPDL